MKELLSYFRSVFDPIFPCDGYLWHSVVLVRGFCWSIPRGWRHECCGPVVPHAERRRIFCSDDGISGECLLHHYRRLDLVLHSEHAVQHH